MSKGKKILLWSLGAVVLATALLFLTNPKPPPPLSQRIPSFKGLKPQQAEVYFERTFNPSTAKLDVQKGFFESFDFSEPSKQVIRKLSEDLKAQPGFNIQEFGGNALIVFKDKDTRQEVLIAVTNRDEKQTSVMINDPMPMTLLDRLTRWMQGLTGKKDPGVNDLTGLEP